MIRDQPFCRSLARATLAVTLLAVGLSQLGCSAPATPADELLIASPHRDEIREEIERAFAEGLVDTGYIDLRSVKRHFETGKDRAFARLAMDPQNTFVDDTAHEMAGWPCFQKPQRPAKTSVIEQFGKPAPVRSGSKVGRNEPCPCGSGRKYKKCCGA